MPKSARRRPKIFFSKAPQFWSKAPHFENFPVSMKLKMTPHAIFIAFLCDNFSQSNSKLQNKFKFYYLSKFFLQSGLKSTRPRKFQAPPGSPKQPLWRLSATIRNTGCKIKTTKQWSLRSQQTLWSQPCLSSAHAQLTPG